MNPSTTLARAVVDGLITAGVRHVVLAPGSRSAPLAYALQQAERAGRLGLHVRVDERAAGFLALGLAKVSRIPAVVVTTSGTAVANLHPAVLEAHHALVPMIVLSADRPAELRGIGANQTTTQPGLFGGAVRFEAELAAEVGAQAAQAAVEEAVLHARTGGPAAPGSGHCAAGPVHLNVALREPLVPDLRDPPRREWPRRQPDPPTAVPAPTSVAPDIDLPERTLVVIGDLPEPDQAGRLARWAQTRSWPVVAEPFGELPLASIQIAHGPLLLGTSWFAAEPPERIVVAGRVTLSRSVRAALTADPDRVTYLRAGPRWLGPSFDVAETIDLRIIDEPDPAPPHPTPPHPTAWLTRWQRAATAVSAAVAGELPWGSGPALAAAVAAAIPDGATLVTGSSNSVRDLELAVDWLARERTVRVVANRGLAGIDGVVSTSVGVGLASAGPTYALVGDLTFLHDVNALLIGPDEQRPDLTIIVANDDGGGIFSTLEPGEPERAGDFERVFGTPTGARVEDLARAYRIRYARADSAERLAALVAAAPVGISVVEVPIERSGHRELRARLRDLAEQSTAVS